MPEITVHGCNVHFQDTVKSMPRTIVYVHGAGASHRIWRDQWAGLKGTARLVIPDLPGHAESSGTARESVPEYAAWLAGFLGEVGLGHFVLAGHSMGGAIALAAALSGIRGLDALILAGTGAKLRVSPAIFDGFANRFPEFAPEFVDLLLARDAVSDLREELTADVRSTRPQVFLADFRACDAFDVLDRVGSIRVPTLIVNGDDDRLTPLKYGQFLATAIPGAVLKIMHGAGHVAMLEKPTEVNNVVRSFIQSLG
ncbi:MAG: alpha/beta fold hydrolase [Gemmatimonadota bacterium]